MRNEQPVLKNYLDDNLYDLTGDEYLAAEDDDSKVTVGLFKNRKAKINDLLKHFGIFGITGSGKSVTLARIQEIHAEHGIGFTTFDIEGTSFSTIPEVYPKVKFMKLKPLLDEETYEEITSNQKKYKAYFGNLRKQLDFTQVPDAEEPIEKLKEMAEKNYYTSAQTILSFEDIPDNLMGGCIAWIYTHKMFELSTTERILHIIIFDEAQWAMPENHPNCPIDRTIYSSKLQTICGKVMAQGRKRKFLLNFASQRPAFISKAITSQLENGILMRAGPDDHDRYSKMMKNLPLVARKELLAKVQTYESGKAIYVQDGYANPACKVVFRKSIHPDTSPSYYKDRKYAGQKKKEYLEGSAV